jgi:ABC-type polysaccharide/polyol phosphate transport system ATPase subunit
MDGSLSIVAQNLGIKYDLRMARGRTLRQALGETIHRRRHEDPPFWALRGVSFTVRPGQTLGVIGRNGSGKSTLLLAIAGILAPDAGVMRTFGKTSTLLTLGAGFDPERSGRENVFLNGAFLGLSRAKLEACFDEIVDFSGLGSFIDVPVRKYSTGMRTRLAFSIATQVEPEILLLDEVLGVGDEEFRERSRRRMATLMDRAKTLVIVSHDLGFVKQACNRCLWLANGEVAAFGRPDKVVDAYQRSAAQLPHDVRTVH